MLMFMGGGCCIQRLLQFSSFNTTIYVLQTKGFFCFVQKERCKDFVFLSSLFPVRFTGFIRCCCLLAIYTKLCGIMYTLVTRDHHVCACGWFMKVQKGKRIERGDKEKVERERAHTDSTITLQEARIYDKTQRKCDEDSIAKERRRRQGAVERSDGYGCGVCASATQQVSSKFFITMKRKYREQPIICQIYIYTSNTLDK